MKILYFENMRSREQYRCRNDKDVQTIDGVEYLRVSRLGENHECLVKRDVLRRVPELRMSAQKK